MEPSLSGTEHPKGHAEFNRPGSWIHAVLFGIAVIALGGLIGLLTAPGTWYEALHKPPFNPPSWVFAPVWLFLYVLIGTAGWRSIVLKPDGLLAKLWGLQMALNYLWSPVFFGLKSPVLALCVIVALLIAIVSYVRTAWARDRPAAVMFIPYMGWVAFATLLNASLVALN